MTITLRNENNSVEFNTLGATVLSWHVKDINGIWRDILVGWQEIPEGNVDNPYLNCIVGRVANRIENGKFSLNGKNYQLPINNGPNHLHGGPDGFCMVYDRDY